MIRICKTPLQLTVLAVAIAGCSARQTAEPAAGSVTANAATAAPAESLRSESFSLELLDNGSLGLQLQDLTLEESALPNGAMQLRIAAGRDVESHGLCCRIHFDESALSVSRLQAGELLSALPGQLLELSGSSRPGVIDYGLVQADYGSQPAARGPGELAVLQFSPAAATPVHQVSHAPETDAARASIRLSTGNPYHVSWNYKCPGDYDANGEVNVADLTPLGQNFGESGPFNDYLQLHEIDGDGNGELNIADISPIGQNYGATVSAYAIYSSLSADAEYPAANTEQEKLAAVAEIKLKDAKISKPGNRPYFEYVGESELLPKQVFWVRPLDQQQQPGTPSNRSDQPSGSALGSPPICFITADVQDAEVPFTINFNMSDSYDPDGDEIEYTVFAQHLNNVLSSQTSQNSLASMDITEPGNYRAYVNASDGYWGSISGFIHFSATSSGNHEPQAAGSLPDDVGGDAPYTFVVDMSASSDADGDNLRYLVDIGSPFEPQGYMFFNSIDIDNGSDPLATVTLPDPGRYDIYVHVIDSKGARSYVHIGNVEVSEAGNLPPRLWISPSPSQGSAPLEAVYQRQENVNYDPDGEIVRYEMDPEGDGNWIEFNWENNDFYHTYEKGGIYRARVRAQDDKGLWGYATSVNVLSVTGNPSLAPTAVLTASDTSGIFVLETDLDASGSSDADGVIVGYEFDFDDGVGWRDFGLNPLVHRSFGPGTHTVKVRVTDSQGHTAEDSVELHVLFINP